MRQLVADKESPNYYLKVKAMIPIKDNCLAGLRERFGEDSGGLPIFKSCSLLNPERFSEIAKSGVPSGALDNLCALARVDPSDVSTELATFSKAYPDLIKNIQADFRPSPNLAALDVDFQVNKDGIRLILVACLWF